MTSITELTPKGGHTLKVIFRNYRANLELVCHEPDGSELCRLVCARGCETAEQHRPDHPMESTECNAILWLQDEPEEACAHPGSFPLHDGMPIRVTWDGVDTYEWAPILDTEREDIIS
jgi:hypothetical protein